LAAHSIFYITS